MAEDILFAGDYVMPSLFSRLCNACNGQHALMIADADMSDAGGEYEYVCPRTQKTVQFTTTEWGQTINHRPKNVIEVRKVDSRS